ncbi:Glu/Leu/Phe/Val dehydrogenase [archaeon]|jgi:glutamate dehydrogenase (NAD(P)+)|nr:Glu/Leu/Phe/Val dehydrogenase [archaeon]MBT4417344.1 Glu/Leu/Phe/Val dehydrogenase [archaeon]
MNDDIGPEKVIKIYDPKTGMKGIVCIDNTKLGPAKGGCRMRPDVTEDEVFRLARAMSLKCSMAGLPFGGGKSGIIADPKKFSAEEKKAMVVAYGKALKNLAPAEYITAPDINMAEEEMKWIVEGNGDNNCCTGKPKEMGGIPHELGSTGFGVVQSCFVGLEHLGMDVSKITFAVEGFGNVGEFAVKFLTEKGAKLVAVSDSRGLLVNPDGIDFEKIKAVKDSEGTVTKGDGEVKESKDILDVKADVLITAAIKDLISDDDVSRLQFKLVVQGSNIPMTLESEKKAAEKGVLIIPDFVANAGGVISSYVEFKGGSVEEMWKLVEEKIVANTKEMLAGISGEKCPREVAMEIARKRILE